jgi:hypothetical protein
MSELRAIDPAPFRARYAGPSLESAGERPELQWVKISRLRIDPKYQREIADRGAKNVVSIATRFRWSKFEPVMIAPIADGLFAVINGQHRATAAALRGFESIPCCIVKASVTEQADSFVAINGDVTVMTPLQLHAARLAAGDPAAVKLVEACTEAGVAICRYPVPANKVKPGETLAIGMLRSALDKYGREVLVAALSCITQTRKGNPGMIRAALVEALCVVLESEPAWRADRARLIFIMQTFDFAAQFNTARAKSIGTGTKVSAVLVEAIAGHLDSKSSAAPAAPAQAPAKPAAPAPVKASPAPPAPAAKPVAAVRPAAATGVLSIGRDQITFNGRHVRVSPRQALLVAALAKAKPNCIGDDFLISKIWNVRPANAGELLNQLVIDLAPLRAIGLEVRTQRGVGRQLVEVAA